MKKVVLWSILVFVIALGLRCYYIAQKSNSNWHIDELAVHVIPLKNTKYWDNFFSVPITPAISIENEKDIRRNLKILGELRKDNHDDFTHTNLHYSVHRLWSSFGSAQLSFKECVRLGCSLNLIFFGISFFFMYKLLRLVFYDEKYVPLALAAAYWNTGSISNTLFIRCYQMQEMMFVVLAYYFVKLWQRKDKIFANRKEFAALTLVLFLTLMTHYLSIIYVAILGTVLLVHHIHDVPAVSDFRGRLKAAAKRAGGLLLSAGCALLLCRLAYVRYFKFDETFLSATIYRNFTEITGNDVFTDMYADLYFLSIYALHYFVYFPLLCLIIFAALYIHNRVKADKVLLILICASVFWNFVVIHIEPYRNVTNARYFMAAMPVMALITPYILSKLNGKIDIAARSACMLILFLYAIFPILSEEGGDYFNNVFRSNILYPYINYTR